MDTSIKIDSYKIELWFLYWHNYASRKAFLFTNQPCDNDKYKGFSIAHLHKVKSSKEVAYKVKGEVLQIMDVKYRIKNLVKSKKPYYLTLITEKGKELLFEGLPAPEW